jgi:hypothetical protein
MTSQARREAMTRNDQLWAAMMGGAFGRVDFVHLRFNLLGESP